MLYNLSGVNRRSAAAFSWLVGLTGALTTLHLLDRGALAGPALTTPAAWRPWLDATPPLDAALAAVRCGLAIVTAYLLAVAVLNVLVVAFGWHPLAPITRAITVPAFRGALGLALVT